MIRARKSLVDKSMIFDCRPWVGNDTSSCLLRRKRHAGRIINNKSTLCVNIANWFDFL